MDYGVAALLELHAHAPMMKHVVQRGRLLMVCSRSFNRPATDLLGRLSFLLHSMLSLWVSNSILGDQGVAALMELHAHAPIMTLVVQRASDGVRYNGTPSDWLTFFESMPSFMEKQSHDRDGPNV